MRVGAGWALLLVVLCGDAAAATDLPLQGNPTRRSQASLAGTGSVTALPGLTRVVLPPVTPEESAQAIRSVRLPANLNPHLAPAVPRGRKALAPALPPSIVELARALKNDPDLIYEFVRNNIDYYPIWGTQKGALGALLDSQGTAFDQAALMVALLRQAGHTASFVLGRIALTGADVGAWLGIDTADACAVQDLFAAGRIPVSQISSVGGGCTALSNMQFDHLWVKVDIGGTNYFFDPSFKPHTLKTGINLAAATGYDATAYLNSAKAGATVDADYIQNINRANVRANLTTLANTLATHVRANLPAGDLADLVGGRSIIPHAGPNLRQSTLPYQNLLVPVTEFTDIPDSYKPTLRIQYAGIDATFTSDAIGSARLTITYDGTNHAVLSLDGTVVGTSPGPLTPNTSGDVDLTVTHNAYGTTSADGAFTQPITAGGSYLIGSGWGPAGRGPAAFHGRRLDVARAAGAGDASEVVVGSTLAVLSTNWLAQANQAFRIIERMGGATTTFHHQIGIAGHDKSPYVDLPGNLVSVTSQTSDFAREDAVFFSQGMHGSIFESVAVEQTSGVSALSTVKLVDLAAASGLRIYNATSANYAGAVEPNMVACSMADLASFQSAVTAGNRLILPSRCDLNENAWTGTGYFIISSDLSSVGSLISGNLAGGFGSQPQPLAIMVGEGEGFVKLPTKKPELLGPTGDDPIDLASGHYLYYRADMATGTGPYPFSLSFNRAYSSGARTTAGPLGNGWSHGLAAAATVGSDGLQGMGEDLALSAVGSVAEMMVSLDLLLDAGKPLDKMLVATLGQRWFGDQLQDNMVVVRQGLKGELFVKLPDGTYSAPPNNSSRLIRNGDGTFTLETLHKSQMNFNAAGKIASHVHPNGVQVKFTYTGNDLTQVQNSLGRTLAITNSGGRVTGVSDGTRSIAYAYDGSGNLVSFTDAAAAGTTFQYDLPGRLTKLFYPANPGIAFVTNVYDSLDRVQTQTNANGKVWNYFFAGTRTESVAPDDARTITYHDGFGNVLKSIDPLGRAITNLYDAQSRLIKSVRPEGNAYELEYDDAPCQAQLRCTHNLKTLRATAKPASGLPDLVTTYTHESAFNHPLAMTDPRGKTTDYSYTALGEPLQILRPQDGGGTRPQQTFTYTSFAPGGAFPSFSLLTKGSILIAAGDTVDTTISYNAANRYVPQVQVVDAGPGNLNLTTTYTYDASGDLTQVDGPRSDVADITARAYDPERRIMQVTDALGRQSRRGYDADGRVAREAMQLGAQWMVTCRTYSPSGALLKTWGPGLTASDTTCPAASAPVAVTDLVYDDLDRPVQVIQNLTAGQGGNRVSERVYLADGRIQFLKAAVGTGLAQTESAFTYTPNGLVATRTDAKNNRTSYTYDGFDRKARTLFPDKVTPNTSSATDFEQYDYDANSNVTAMRNRNGQVIGFAYDDLNRQVARTYPDSADNVNLGYDLVGHLLFANHADASYNVSFAWDHRDRLTSTTAGGRTISHLYDAAGNRIRTTWPEATPFFVTTGYDALNRPTAIEELGTTTLATYAYDDLSRRTTVSLGNATSTAFGYDNQRNLASIAHDLGGTAKDVVISYTRNQAQEITGLDASNALYDWNGAAPMNAPYAANGLNQYTSAGGAGHTYDNSGNLTGNGTWAYLYDTENRLRSASGPVAGVLAWDGVNRLRQTTIAGVTTQLLYGATGLIAEYDGGGTLLRRYVHGPGIDEPLVKYEGAGTGSKSWFYPDHQGSIVATADAAGTPVATINYGPFGEPGTTSPARFGYTGQQFLNGLGLYHYRARAYSPALGRFLQPDPIGLSGGTNLYAYVRNDPVNHYDPTGLWTVQIGLAGSGLLGMFAGQTGAGIAIDHHGNIGIYGYNGVGVGAGLEAGLALSLQGSTAETIYDLAGKFENVSGAVGAFSRFSLDLFRGSSDNPADQGSITGAGITFGVGGGAGVSWTNTWTDICGIFSGRCEGPISDFVKAIKTLTLAEVANTVFDVLKKNGYAK